MRCFAVAILFAAALPAGAADRWLRFTTPNFELYTSGDEKAGRDAISYFEQVRGFFIKASPVRFPGEFPVRIVVFAKPEDFSAYSRNPIEIAFFAAGARRDYIVMADASLQSYAIAVHEYMHLIVRHSGLHIPVWLNEGLADVYSSLRPVPDGVAVGDLIPGRLQPLREGRWLSFDSLTSATTKSADYNESDRAGVFYAESWALTHMLFLSPGYRENFGRFLVALNRGKTSAEACEIAYGKSSAEVFQDLQKYMAGNKFYGRIFQTKLGSAETQPAVSPVPEIDSRLMLADLLTSTGSLDRAKAIYRQLEAEQPRLPEVSQALGYFALAEGDAPLARNYFEKAFAEGGSDPQMCLRLALLQRGAGQSPAQVIPALERALRAKPDYGDALIQLGLIKIKTRQFASAIDILMKIQNVTPEQATPLFSGLAYAYLESGDVQNARKNVQVARKWAVNPEETAGVDRLSAFIEARAGGSFGPHPGEKLEETEGTLLSIDCTKDPHRMNLIIGQKTVSFLLGDPAGIEFTQPGGGSLQLSCGTQPPRQVTVTYVAGSVVEKEQQRVVRAVVYGPEKGTGTELHPVDQNLMPH